MWTLFGTLVDAAKNPVPQATVTVYPPAESYNDVPGSLLTRPYTATTGTDGTFTMTVDSVPGIVWLIQVDNDQPVTIPDPGDGQSININRLTPAYVPNWMGGKRVAVGAGIAALRTVGTDLVATLTNGSTLPPVPLWSGSALDADDSARALMSFAQAHLIDDDPCVVVMGQGDAEGAGSTMPSNRWMNVLMDSLRSNYSKFTDDRGVGYVPALYSDQSMASSNYRTSSGGNVSLVHDAGGLGFRTALLEPDADDPSMVTWPAFDCSSITVYYPTDAERKGSLQVWVDGVKVTTLSCDPGANEPNAAASYTWRGLDGAHTLRIIRDTVNDSPALVHGAYFATSDQGVRVYDASSGGDSPQTASMLANGPLVSPGAQTKVYQSLAALQPNLVILSLGQADMTSSTYLQWGADLATVAQLIKTACPQAGILLVHSPMLLSDANTPSVGSVRTLIQFEDEARNAIATKAGASMLSLGRIWNPQPGAGAAQQDPWGWLDADGTAPSDTGHALIANYIVALFRKVLSGGVVTSIDGKSGAVILTGDDIKPGGSALNPAVVASGVVRPGSYADGSGQWTPLPTRSSLSQQRGMVPFKAALATGTAKVLFLGDGKAEGAGATVLDRRWQSLVTASLREQAFGSSGADQGAGYVPVWNTSVQAGLTTGQTPVFSNVEDVDYTLLSDQAGLGLRSARLFTVGTTITFPGQACRYLTICYTSVANGGGVVDVLVDGQTQTSIDTTMGDSDVVVADGMGVGRVSLDLNTVDVRQVQLRVSSGTPTIEGVFFATSLSGLSVADSTRQTFNLVGPTQGAGSVSTADQLEMAALANFNPDLIVLATGTTEQSTGDDASWREDLTAYLQRLAQHCPAAGILMLQGAARPVDVRDPAIGLARSAAYSSTAQQVTDQSSIASAVFESALWQPTDADVSNPLDPVEQDPFGWLADDTNPSDLGHARIAEHLLQTIIPGTGAAVNANTLTTTVLDSALASDMANISSASRSVLDATYERRDLFRGLLPWRAAYANRRHAAASIAVVSDFEGIGATPPVWANTWQQILADQLAGTDVGQNLVVPAYSPASQLVANATMTPSSGVGTPAVAINGSGVGGKILQMPSGASASYPARPMTGFRVWYRGISTDGSADVSVDGTVVGTIDGSVATEAGVWPADGWNFVANGSHTVEITSKAKQFELAAVEFANGDETTGVHMYDHSRYAMRMEDATSSGSVAGMWKMIAAQEPSLLIIMLGADDLGKSPDTYTSSLVSLQQNIDAALVGTSYSILLAMSPKPVLNPPGTTAQWNTYVDACRAVAAAYPTRCSFVDLQGMWPDLVLGGSTSLGLMVEDDYPFNFSPAGQQAVADALYRVLG